MTELTRKNILQIWSSGTPITKAQLKNLDHFDWTLISKEKLPVDFLLEFKDYLHWDIITIKNKIFFVKNPEVTQKLKNYLFWDILAEKQKLPLEFIDYFKKNLNFEILLKHQKLPGAFFNDRKLTKNELNIATEYQKLPISFIRENKENLDWTLISKFQDLSEKTILEFKDKVNWHYINLKDNISKEFKDKNNPTLNLPEYNNLNIEREYVESYNQMAGANVDKKINLSLQEKKSYNLLKQIFVVLYSDFQENDLILWAKEFYTICDKLNISKIKEKKFLIAWLSFMIFTEKISYPDLQRPDLEVLLVILNMKSTDKLLKDISGFKTIVKGYYEGTTIGKGSSHSSIVNLVTENEKDSVKRNFILEKVKKFSKEDFSKDLNPKIRYYYNIYLDKK